MRKVIGNCPMPDCGKSIHCKGFCRSHYRKLFGENEKRWQKVKHTPELLKRVQDLNKEYKKSEFYLERRKQHDHAYYLKNKKEINTYRKRWYELQRFGTYRDNILKRDGYKCMLNGKHSETLIVHHKNGLGRCTDNPDNDPENLITLCRSHHMKIHNPTKGLTQV